MIHSIRGAAVRVAAAAALILVTSIGAVKADPLKRVASAELLALDGAWVSRGYGILWYVKDREVTAYEISGRYCLREDHSEGLPGSAAATMLINPQKNTIEIGVADGIGYRHIFDRRDKLPARCREEPDTSPAGVFDAVAEIFTHRYAFFGRRGINWAELVRLHRLRVRDDMADGELFSLLSQLLGHLGDEHVGLSGTVDGRARRFAPEGKRLKPVPVAAPTEVFQGYWKPAAGLKLLGGQAQSNASGTLVYGTIDGTIGYLNVKSLWWRRIGDLDETLDRAMALFRSVELVVVDLSDNGGGGEDLGKRIAERFTAKRTHGLSKYPGDSPGARPQAIYLEPSRGTRFLGATYIITSEETFSAAETTAMYMGVLDNVTHIGARTAGALSDVLEFSLPNGWRVGLSNEVYLDNRGRSWEGIGIPPTINVTVTTEGDDVSGGDLDAARRVLAQIKRHSEQGAGRR